MENDLKDLIEIRNGWAWPKFDYGCWTFLNNPKRGNVPETISKHVENRRVVIQAGGNAGMYPRMYEEFFDVVYTFEPDPLNFYCLTQNTTSKTIKFQSCLGNERKLISLSNRSYKENANCGGFHVQGNGNIPTVRIDDLSLMCCDLIHLDIEGYELEALLGAETTIKKYSPVIVLELINLSTRYQTTDQAIRDLLHGWGYSAKANIRKEDFIFTRNKSS